jgi:hypothetical protein
VDSAHVSLSRAHSVEYHVLAMGGNRIFAMGIQSKKKNPHAKTEG